MHALDLSRAAFKVGQLTDQWVDESVDVRLLEASSAPADERIAEALNVPLGERTLLLRRLLTRAGEPVMYHHEYVRYDPRRPLVESQLRITSLEGTLKAAGTQGFARGKLIARAVTLSETEANLLHQPPQSAAFCLEHIFKDFEGVTVSWGMFLCRSDLFWLETDFGMDESLQGGSRG